MVEGNLVKRLRNLMSFVWNNVPIGSYTLTAVASDNSNATRVSNTVHFFVIDPNTSSQTEN